MPLCIGLTYDLRDEYRKLGYSEEAIAEFDSRETIDAIESALKALGYVTERIGNIWKLTEALAEGKRWDLVFNISEGMFGLAREAQVPALLEAYQIPYVFSAPEVMIWCHHKAMAKKIVAEAGLATAAWQVVNTKEDIAQINLAFPLFAKPLAEGTSKGISQKSLVNNKTELKAICEELLMRFNQPVLVETYLSGREFTVGIVGTGEKAVAIGAVELKQAQGGETAARTYANKEQYEVADDYILARDMLAKKAMQLALDAWRALGCRDGGRVDIRCDALEIPHFIEANPLAGMKPGHSDLPMLAELNGINYTTLIGRMVDSARERREKQCASLSCATG